MRTKTIQISSILSHPSHTAIPAITLWDSMGTLRDIRAEDILTVDITTGVDGPTTAKITMRRQYGFNSNVPIISPFLWGLAWRVLVSCTVVPQDLDSGVALVVFDGYIDNVTWPDDVMTVDATDKTAKLRDTFIESERVYGLAQGAYATKGVYAWAPGVIPEVGDLFIPSEARRNSHFYRVTAAVGVALTTEPTWATSGVTYGEGGAIEWTESGATSDTIGVPLETLIAQLFADNGLSAFPIYTPVSPSWNVKPYLQQCQSVLEAVTAMVDQLGWTFRSEWYASASEFRFTLAEPPRTATTSVRVFRLDEERALTDAGANVFDIRNAIRVTYWDSSAVTPDGKPARKQLVAEDAGSVVQYGRRFMGIQEADSSSIDTATEATRMATAALADLKDPLMGVSYETAIDPWLQLGDIITLPADNLRWAAAQKLAIVGLTHSIGADGASTVLSLSGHPVGSLQGWLEMDARSDMGGNSPTTLAQSGLTSLAITRTIGGVRISVDQTQLMLGSGDRSFEFHVSSTSGFAPSSATLRQSGVATSCVVSDLIPGATYYARVIPYSTDAGRVVRGDPSEPVTFVATKTTCAYYDSTATQSHLPLNGNFEHITEAITTTPPDHWALGSGETWGATGSVYYGTDTLSGRYVVFRAQGVTRGVLTSSQFEVRRGAKLAGVYLSVYTPTLYSGNRIRLRILMYSDSALTVSTGTATLYVEPVAAGGWELFSLNPFETSAIPNNTNFVVIEIGRDTTTATHELRVGDVFFVEDAPSSQEGWNAPSFVAGWGNFGLGYAAVGVMKESTGFITLRGMAARTSGSSATILTLPTGYRPTATEIFSTTGNYLMQVTAAGNVDLLSGDPSIVSLSGIRFDTR